MAIDDKDELEKHGVKRYKPPRPQPQDAPPQGPPPPPHPPQDDEPVGP